MCVAPMRANDLDAVLAVQAACYPPAMQEAADVVLARLAASPDTVLVARDGGGVCAYLFAYPSRLGKVTPLGGAFVVPADADTLYLHDLAVAPRALGRGLARRLVAGLFERVGAPGLPHAALVAVQDSRRFWEAQGFAPGVPDLGGAAVLAAYPAGSVYMVRAGRPAA